MLHICKHTQYQQVAKVIIAVYSIKTEKSLSRTKNFFPNKKLSYYQIVNTHTYMLHLLTSKYNNIIYIYILYYYILALGDRYRGVCL